MILKKALQAIPERICRRPALWSIGLAYTFLLPALHSTFGPLPWKSHHLYPMAAFLQTTMHCCTLLVLAAVSPLAWQWTGDDKRIGTFFRSVLQSAGLAAVFYCLWHGPLAGQEQKWLGLTQNSFLKDGLITGLLIALVTGLGYFLASRESHEESRSLFQACLREAQWVTLRNQLSPHLVLNVLNGLAGLTEENPQKAAKGLEDFAEIYQQLLNMADVEEIPLRQEKELLERYLEIEKLRLEKSLELNWQWDKAIDNIGVPPLLIQPLVENAVKHGISTSPSGGSLSIQALLEPGKVRIDISNTGSQLLDKSSLAGLGVGIRNLKQCLALRYGNQAGLELRQDGPWIRATLHIPVQP